MRRRLGAVSLGLAVAGVAWIVGSTTLWVLGVGLVLAFTASDVWALTARRSLTVERLPLTATPLEGEQLTLEARVHGRRLLAARAEWREQVGALGERVARVPRSGRSHLVLDDVPRGRYALGPGRLVLDDPLGLIRLDVIVPSEGSIVVRPRVPELATLFTDTGAWSGRPSYP